ncbi:MAG: hypothetical protein IBJ00_02330 [Alphaproteobacteria bacterium]|nr:hypothetical protein [Alphaproteobacteria bacterium]
MIKIFFFSFLVSLEAIACEGPSIEEVTSQQVKSCACLIKIISLKIENDKESLWFPTYKFYNLDFLQKCTEECNQSDNSTKTKSCKHNTSAINYLKHFSIENRVNSDFSYLIFSKYRTIKLLDKKVEPEFIDRYAIYILSICKFLKISSFIEYRLGLKSMPNHRALTSVIESAKDINNTLQLKNKNLCRILQFSYEMEDLYKLAQYLAQFLKDSKEENQEFNNIWRLIARSWEFTCRNDWHIKDWELYARALGNAGCFFASADEWKKITETFNTIEYSREYAQALSRAGKHKKALIEWKKISSISRELYDKRSFKRACIEAKSYELAVLLMKEIYDETQSLNDKIHYALSLSLAGKINESLQIWQSMGNIPPQYLDYYNYIKNESERPS